MHCRKLFLVLMFISLIRAHYAVRVDTSEKSESAPSEASDQPKAEALTLLIQKRVPLRPNVKVIERRDDVVVIHKNARSKKRQATRGRRRPSNQFRSKIRPSGNSNSFGGFKDFSSNDLRFPPFPSKPPRASNKLKFSSSGASKRTPSYDFNSQSKRPPRPSQVVKTVSTIYGPPATSFNQIDSFSSPVTLQQAQTNFPTFEVETVEPIKIRGNSFGGGNKNFGGSNDFRGSNRGSNNKNFNNDFGGSSSNFGSSQNFGNDFGNLDFDQGNKFGSSSGNFRPGSFNSNINFGSSSNNFQSNNEVNRFSSGNSLNTFPLGEGSSFNVPKTSYGEPVRSASSQSTKSYNFNSIVNQQANSNKNSGNSFPKLPSRYETSDFTTPTRHNPLNTNNFDFGNLDVLSETKNVLSSVPNNVNRGKNRFNKFNNFDYEFGSKDYDDDDDDDDDSFAFTTRRPLPRFTATTSTTPFPTTTKRSKKGVFGKRKRPAKITQSHNDHNLDVDELRDAFEDRDSEASNDDIHEVKLHAQDGYLNFDSMRNIRKGSGTSIHEIHSTLKAARKNPALRQALGDDFQILSIEKSLEKNPTDVDLSGLRLQRRGDEEENQQEYQEFSVGSEINFSDGASNPNQWNGDIDSFPRNHRFSK